MWENKNIYLRTVQMSDLQTLLTWENDPKNWEVSDTSVPFSEEEMIDFIVEQTFFLTSGQLRLLICLTKNELPIGAIDLFDISVESRSAGVGILIHEKKHRNKGYATQALQSCIKMAKEELKLLFLTCEIHHNNHPSIRLFENSGFTKQADKETIGHYDRIL